PVRAAGRHGGHAGGDAGLPGEAATAVPGAVARRVHRLSEARPPPAAPGRPARPRAFARGSTRGYIPRSMSAPIFALICVELRLRDFRNFTELELAFPA